MTPALDLEQRCTTIDRSALIAELLQPLRVRIRHDPACRKKLYSKTTTAEEIAHHLARTKKMTDGSATSYLLGAMNHEPLKRIFYGAVNYDDSRINLLPSLWLLEASYFVAGVHHIKAGNGYCADPFARATPYAIILTHIKDGINHLRTTHAGTRQLASGETVTYHTRGYVDKDPQLPYAADYLDLSMPALLPAPSPTPPQTPSSTQQPTLFDCSPTITQKYRQHEEEAAKRRNRGRKQ